MNALLSTRARAVLLLIAVGLGIGSALLLNRRALRLQASEMTEALPVLGNIGPFALTGADGAPVTLATFHDRVWVANLFFTTCGSICPRLTRNLAALQQTVGPDVPFDLLSVSVDPAQDTPPVLAAFALTYQADTNRWHFATAPLAAVRAFATDNLHLTPGEAPVGHSPHVVLIDRAGQVRGYYDGLDVDALARLATDLKRVVNEGTQ